MATTCLHAPYPMHSLCTAPTRSDYKRQRQRYTSETKSLLSMGAGGGSRSASRTSSPPDADSSRLSQPAPFGFSPIGFPIGATGGGSHPVTSPAPFPATSPLAAREEATLLTPPPASAGTPLSKPGTATTDTARRILQTLDNMGKVRHSVSIHTTT